MEMYNAVLSTLAVVNIFLLGALIIAFGWLYNASLQKPQRLLLICLCVCEATQNILRLVHPSTYIFDLGDDNYVCVVELTLQNVVHLTLIFLSIERLARFILNMVYTNYWGVTRTLVLLGITAVTAVITAITIFHSDERRGVMTKFYLSLDFILISCVLVSYSVVLLKYKQSGESVKQRLKKSAFVVPSLLVTTFVLFFIVPNVITACYHKGNITVTRQFKFVRSLLHIFTSLTHALILITLLKDVNHFLLKRTYFCLRTTTSRSSSDESNTSHVTDEKDVQLLAEDPVGPIDAQCSKRVQQNEMRKSLVID